ncbi:hypothetical protein RF55_13435 [Lasius niger]|uniref:Uncharacterized protein n=1 Tax=Lasius niger TaxID=67767 RepID=A0A0J7KA38_LASNI|nr:hypothetical protein RF55_13435 [Lasius niger]
MISQFVEKDQREWDENLPALQFAYNTATHDATGFSPAYLNYGQELCPPHPGEEARDRNIKIDTLPEKLDDAYALNCECEEEESSPKKRRKRGETFYL